MNKFGGIPVNEPADSCMTDLLRLEHSNPMVDEEGFQSCTQKCQLAAGKIDEIKHADPRDLARYIVWWLSRNGYGNQLPILTDGILCDEIGVRR